MTKENTFAHTELLRSYRCRVTETVSDVRCTRCCRSAQRLAHGDARGQSAVGLLLLHVPGDHAVRLIDDDEAKAGVPRRVVGHVTEGGEAQLAVAPQPRFFAAGVQQGRAEAASPVSRVHG